LPRQLAGARLGQALAHEGAAVAFLDAPALEVVERGRVERLAGAQAEARVVPRAADRVAHQQALG
jgi:Ran GTPase-activating protein (RanGAP) involved in mRNA processing and transport